jgi:hypothetical protein
MALSVGLLRWRIIEARRDIQLDGASTQVPGRPWTPFLKDHVSFETGWQYIRRPARPSALVYVIDTDPQGTLST